MDDSCYRDRDELRIRKFTMSSQSRLIGEEFRPPIGLRHRHVQSVMSKVPWRRRLVRERATALLACSQPEVVDGGDGVRLLGYYSPSSGRRRGLVILLHGWEGSADSSYVLSAGTRLFESGYSVFRLNLRDHGNTHALNEDLFHSCRIGEVVNAVKNIHARHPADRLFLVGQSLGGNFAMRVAVRAQTAGVLLSRVVAVCPVLQPQSTMQALEQGLWIYRHYFLSQWRQSLRAKAAAFPQRYDFGSLERFRTLTETTDFFVREYTEFSSLDDYLEGYAITGSALAGLNAPTVLIAARDDPVIPSRDLARLARPDTLTVTQLPFGGHCGFVESYSLRSWVDERILAELENA
jgi:predicted alpha/beta-fold hydrolase